MMLGRTTLFGISEAGWKTVDAVSLSIVLSINAAKLLKMSKKTKKYAQFGLKNKQWDKMNTASDVLLIFTLLRGLVDTLEEYDAIVGKDAIFPGRGLIPEVVVSAAKGLKSVPGAVTAIPGRTADSLRNFF
jgi:hypothetical protein